MHYLEQVHRLAVVGFKARNEGTVLGVLWYLLNPLLLFGLLLLVFYLRLGQDIPAYPLYLLLGIIMFNFFRQVTLEATRIIEMKRFLIRATRVPLSAVVTAVVYKLLLGHLFEIIVFGMALLVFSFSPVFLLWYLPILACFVVFLVGCSLLFFSVSAYFRDMEHIWIFLSQLLWFATPIFYDIGGQAKLFYLNMLNPLFYFIEVARSLIIYHTFPSWWMLIGVVGWSVVLMVVGGGIFLLLRRRIPELV